MTASSPTEVVVEICGEGKTEVGQEILTPVTADVGVLPVLVRRLCLNPIEMRVVRRRSEFLQGKQFWQKVWFFKRNASINGSAGAVFAVDTEGKAGVLTELQRGRDHGLPNLPMAVGVAHPCIESWLLSDASAIRRGFNLSGPRPTVPHDPESLPAPQANRTHNPKAELAACHPHTRHPNLAEKSAIAEHLNFATAEAACPSFAAFADEVRTRIRDRLFPPPPPPPPDAVTPTAEE